MAGGLPCGEIATTFGLPSVSVPVLSNTRVSTFSSVSSASAFADEDAGVGAAAGAYHDCHRRCQAQRAGAGDDQHGHGIDYGVRQARLRAEYCPGEEC
jgi:hypothetical protein